MVTGKNVQGPPRGGLWQPGFERDACGFGLMARLDGEPRRELVADALVALARMTHRGAIAADGRTGDGCGLLVASPESFLRTVASERDIHTATVFAAGMVFLDPDAGTAEAEREILHRSLTDAGLEVAGWRVVPIDASVCGVEAERTRPRIEQVFVNAPADMDTASFRRTLYVGRRQAERELAGHTAFHVVSLSPDVLGYKGLVMPEALPAFYIDLRDERFSSAICVFHQRFSTNTLPKWPLAQPFRLLAHNGEINTIDGNRNWAEARTALASLKAELMARGEATDLFARERGDGLDALLGNLDQTIFGEPAYPSVEAKAAHLLYFVVKNHPFADGNKRSAAYLFVDFLYCNDRLLNAQGEVVVNDVGLAALTLLIAESDPANKETMVRLIMNMLVSSGEA